MGQTGRTILVIEDEELIAASIAVRLTAEGFEVETAADGPSGVELCERLQPALVILDLMLPGFDGIEVCRRIQAQRQSPVPVPVIMLTAKANETDKLVGLGVGADDYMTKPFSPRELVARVHAVLRRTERSATDSRGGITVGDLLIDPETWQVTWGGEVVHLTRTEFSLLEHMARRAGVAFSREQLLVDVWKYADASGPRTVDSHIASLRRKLGPDVVRTVRGVGYALAEAPGA